MIIYKITNTINGKVYIGQTRYSLAHRWAAHCRVKSHCTALAGAIQKYGRKAFTKEVLFTSDCTKEITAMEIKLIKEYSSMTPNGYNLTEGGEGCLMTEETKQKIAASKQGVNNPMYGKKMSPEHRAKISAALKGKKRPQEVKDKISKGHNPKSNLNLTYRRKPNNPNMQQG